MKRNQLLTVALTLLFAGWAAYLVLGTFAAHMTAHVIAVAIAAPLVALALPGPAILRTVSAGLLACAFEFVLVWGWHVPAMHDLARSSVAVFLLEQGCFLVAGYAVWASALGIRTTSAPAASGLAGVGTLLLTSMHMCLLGGLLILVPGATFLAAAHDPVHGLADRRLGGAIMLALGGMSYLAGALVLLQQTLARDTSWRDTP